MADTILLIGGSGFIGQALAHHLVKQGRLVTILSRHHPPGGIDGVSWRQGDASTTETLQELLPECSAIVYLATMSTPGHNIYATAQEAQENLQPLLRLLELLVNYPKVHLVYFSSGGSIYGNPAYLPVDEKHPLAPLSHHAACKAAAEQFLGVFARQGHTVTILRPSNVYGAGQPLRPGFGVIRTLLEHIKQNTPITIWGSGETSRDYLYITDLIEACEAVLNEPATGIFNLGSGTPLSLNHLCRRAEYVTGKHLKLRHEPARSVDVRTIALDSAAFRQRYKWQPQTAIDEGLRLTWEWLLTGI